MKEFLVGLFVIIMLGVVSLLGGLLLPLLLLLGIFLRFFVAILIGLIVIWFIGKITLSAIEYFNRPKE